MDESGKRRKVVFASPGDENVNYCLAKDCIKLHLVGSIDDLQHEVPAFCPSFLEEHFGDSGKIYGYKGLKVDIWLHNASFHAYADVKYDSVVPNRKMSHDKLDTILKKVFGNALVANREAFFKQLKAYNSQFSDLLTKHAEPIASWEAPIESSSGGDKQYQIFRLELGSQESRDWHQRLNPLVLWFVEGASCIEVDDPRWEVYVAVETTSGATHKMTGFCNVYRFFHYPDSTRLRISQILVLPPYQKQHHGFHLVNCVNDMAVRRNCFDVTMEDPSDKLQLLRDCMDVLRLLNFLPLVTEVRRAVQRIKEGKAAAEELQPPSNLAAAVRQEFKISKAQCKRCWEAIVLLHLGPAADKAFTDLVSKRLCAELFDDKENERPLLKHVVDTENEYDSSKTFVMMKFKNKEVGEEAQAQEEPLDTSERDAALKELTTEKKSHILSVIKKVASLCKIGERPVHLDLQAWIEQS